MRSNTQNQKLLKRLPGEQAHGIGYRVGFRQGMKVAVLKKMKAKDLIKKTFHVLSDIVS